MRCCVNLSIANWPNRKQSSVHKHVLRCYNYIIQLLYFYGYVIRVQLLLNKLFWLIGVKQTVIAHQCRETAVLNCHRFLINSGVEKMNKILIWIRTLTPQMSLKYEQMLVFKQLLTFLLNMLFHLFPQFNDLGLEALEARLNKLDMERAAEITRNTCASPTSLILALIYLDRMRSSNPAYLYSVSSTDLFLVSLVSIYRFD